MKYVIVSLFFSLVLWLSKPSHFPCIFIASNFQKHLNVIFQCWHRRFSQVNSLISSFCWSCWVVCFVKMLTLAQIGFFGLFILFFPEKALGLVLSICCSYKYDLAFHISFAIAYHFSFHLPFLSYRCIDIYFFVYIFIPKIFVIYRLRHNSC